MTPIDTDTPIAFTAGEFVAMLQMFAWELGLDPDAIGTDSLIREYLVDVCDGHVGKLDRALRE